MEDISQFKQEQFLEVVKTSSLRVKIAILDPDQKDIVQKLQSVLPTTKDLAQTIRESHATLCEMIRKLPPNLQSNITILKHKKDISDSIIVIDPETENAWIKIEGLLVGKSPGVRPNQSGFKREYPVFYKTHYEDFKNAISTSEPYPCS